MTGSLKDWPAFFAQCYKNLTPGGVLEMQDTDFPLHCDDDTLHGTAMERWGDLITQGMAAIGHDLAASKYKSLMEEAGFVDVVEVRHVWPQNTWPADRRLKELGRWNLVNSLDGLQGYSMALMTRVLGMSTEEVEMLLMDVRKDMKSRKIHAYWPM